MDTRNKRASAIFPLLPFRAILPAPDGTIDQADRQQVVFLYAGILAAAPVGITGIVNLTIQPRLAALTVLARNTNLTVQPRSVELTINER